MSALTRIIRDRIVRNSFVGLASSVSAIALALPASAITFDLSWTGQTLGYTAEGQFSYDESAIAPDGIIRSDDVETFEIAFFTPDGNLLDAFTDNMETPGFNFNFDTQTGEILQTGRWDSSTGLNIGGVRTEELNMFSVGNPGADLFDDDEPSPHVHLTDWGNDFPEAPVGFTRGKRPHLDIAFFTRTQAEVLADPSASDALGEKLIATLATDATDVPEPTALVGLGAIALFTFTRKKRAI